MYYFEKTIYIKKSIQELDDFLTDVNNLSLWNTQIVDTICLTPQPVMKGTYFKLLCKYFLFQLNLTCKVTNYAPYKSFSFKCERPLIVSVSFQYEKLNETIIKLQISQSIEKGIYFFVFHSVLKNKFNASVNKLVYLLDNELTENGQ